MNRTIFFTFAVGLFLTGPTLTADASIPVGYYDECEGKSGKALLTALHNTIGSHTDIGYDALYELYLTSDIHPEDNTIWDMYSTKHWSPSTKCGNYSGVGVCYNREHSFPKSWFGGKVAPMYSDAYHLYPTDGQVNGYRSNYPYGECAGGTTWQTGNVRALGRLGKSTFEGYDGIVFEPDNEYKGDFARSYFYMATCYNDRVAQWSSPMLAGNNYPAFNTWALELLLKWHRNDAVSSKETVRNDAVSAAQHNRNPFIDHPELVEHIWGSKQNEPWHSPDGDAAGIVRPADASSVDFGLTTTGHPVSVAIEVKGRSLTQPLELAIEGDQSFKVGSSTIAASTAMAGTEVEVTFTPTKVGSAIATLVAKSGTASSRVTLKAEAVDGIPLYEAEQITETSFVVRWVDVDSRDAATFYSLDVAINGRSVDGYPRQVAAADEQFEVTGLEPATTYEVSLTSATSHSRTLSITTATPIPSIQLLYDADLTFVAKVGEPSDVAELLIVADNIDQEIGVTVEAPFEVSTDLERWDSELLLDPDEDRFFMRLNSSEAGSFTTVVTLASGYYVNDDVVAEGIVSESRFVETFENASEMKSYDGGIYRGTAAEWIVAAGNIWDDDSNFNASRSMRFSQTGCLTLSGAKDGGIGIVAFDLRKWDNSKDPAATVAVEYTLDGGTTWIEAGSATSEEPRFSRHTVAVNQTGKVGVRLRQTTGKRFNLDNVELTDWAGTTASNTLDYHSWQAYSRDGMLIVATDNDIAVGIYTPDGRTIRETILKGAQTLELPLEHGLYIVTTGDFSRRVVVK